MRTSQFILLIMATFNAHAEMQLELTTGYRPPYVFTEEPKLFASNKEIRGELINKVRQACEAAEVNCNCTMRHPWSVATSHAKSRDLLVDFFL